MSDVFLTGKPGGVDAWVSIGLTGDDTAPAALAFPVMDLYGGNDLPGMLAAAPARAAALRRVPDADRFFSGRERDLVEQVSRLLDCALP